LLHRLARTEGVHPEPWLPTLPVSRALLGLPAGTTVCFFDLDGVLTDSGVLHAHAWAEVFDELLQELAEQTGRHFAPFDVHADYRTFVEGRPRLEGVHSFLASRGIRLSQERAGELARRKASVLAHGLHERGVTALPGARRYLEAAAHAGVKRLVVSASLSTASMLGLAGIGTLVDECVARYTVPPHVAPEHCVAFTRSAHGLAASEAAGFIVEQTPLAQLLDPRIAR
jgi:beta-phosphoglucomutase-like phosphatase (HAD superfamily)